MSGSGPGLDYDALVARDAAELLCRQSVGGLAVSAFASSFLAYMALGRAPLWHVIAWWLAMTGGLAIRSLDLLFSRRRRSSPAWSGGREILRFGCGVVLTAAIWIAFPLVFFSSLGGAGRTAMTIILSAMAGGSATVLGASLSLSIGYCAAMLLPVSIMFLRAGGQDDQILGMLGGIFFATMVLSSRVSHTSTMAALRLSRTNHGLLIEVEGQRNLAEQTNSELQTAQFALRQANLSLEARVQARTVDLEREVAERKRYAEELSRLASTDPLTGLYNRAMLSDRLFATLANAEESGGSVAVLFVDLDKFKEVNDVKGHHAGDRVLQVVAERLSGSLRPGTDLARWGGDEFVVVQKALGDPHEAVVLAEALRESLGRPIEIDLETILIDATIGISIFPEHGKAPDELIRAADVAMYAGKEEKRGKVRIFDPSLAEELVERHQLEQALREAIATDSLSLAFQPIVGASSEQCEALEALLRWDHPARGPIPPSEFIPIAERSGQILSIGSWVLREACCAAASWTGERPPAVSVNVSAAQVLSGDLAAEVFAALVRSGLPPHRLHIELTESLFAGDHGRIVSTLSRLREKGVRVSIDDFGTGFSSLAYLQNLPIDIVKIDRSFVRTMERDSHPVISAIVSISRALNLRMIAEGVENPAQAAMLRAMGVDYFQGYLYAKPLPASSVAQWLAERRDAFALASGSMAEQLAGLAGAALQYETTGDSPRVIPDGVEAR